jgi:hypothetical protein
MEVRMSNPDPIRGKTFRFTFDDGPMAGKTFEHTFDADGKVSFRALGEANKAEPSSAVPSTKFETAVVREDVCAVSYLSSARYTLTTILDFKTGRLVAFSSNEKTLGVQHGSFEEAGKPTARGGNAQAARPQAMR